MRPRIGVMTFVYDGDRRIVLDTLDSLVRSCPETDFDFYFTDDASSGVGQLVELWCHERGFRTRCVTYETNLGYRGAIERTLRLLREIASSAVKYDLIIRIDTDALVVRPGLVVELLNNCHDDAGIYGVTRRMRFRDSCALVLDLLPMGLKRIEKDGRIEHDYALRRLRPVWWSRIGVRALWRGFRFRFMDGCFYALGAQVPRRLLDSGQLELFQRDRCGLITSEEDVVLAMMCKALGLSSHGLEQQDPAWKSMSTIGGDVLRDPSERVPFVVHPLKTSPEDLDLRAAVRRELPFFA